MSTKAIIENLSYLKHAGIESLEDSVKNDPKNTKENTLEKIQDLETLKKSINSIELDIKTSSKNTVFADGDSNASVMLIGEAPGASEDEQGIPFCGPSGKLLNNILLSIGLEREKVYITNTVFWRPPGNRRPTPLELNKCCPFLEKHIELINPKLILLVGSTALEAVMHSGEAISKIQGKLFYYKNDLLKNKIKLMVIYHPSYLLRQPQKKKEMWQVMQKIKKIIDNE